MADKKSRENKIIQDVTKHLDEQVSSDNETLNRALSMARLSALDKAQKSSSGLSHFITLLLKPVPLSAFASITLVVIVFMGLNNTQTQLPEDINGLNELSDIDVLMTEDNLEFYEDLEFYEWLVNEESHSS